VGQLPERKAGGMTCTLDECSREIVGEPYLVGGGFPYCNKDCRDMDVLLLKATCEALVGACRKLAVDDFSRKEDKTECQQ
jgi:hypothetical protein